MITNEAAAVEGGLNVVHLIFPLSAVAVLFESFRPTVTDLVHQLFKNGLFSVAHLDIPYSA